MNVLDLIKDLSYQVDYTGNLTNFAYSRRLVRATLDKQHTLTSFESYSTDVDIDSIFAELFYSTRVECLSYEQVKLLYSNLYYTLCATEKELLDKYIYYDNESKVNKIDYDNYLYDATRLVKNQRIELSRVNLNHIDSTKLRPDSYEYFVKVVQRYHELLVVSQSITRIDAYKYNLLEELKLIETSADVESFLEDIITLVTRQPLSKSYIDEILEKTFINAVEFIEEIYNLYLDYGLCSIKRI